MDQLSLMERDCGVLVPSETQTPGTRNGVSSPMAWYAVRTAPNHERVAHASLTRMGMPSFLPSITRQRKWSDRVKRVEMLVLPGYIFSQIERSKFGIIRSLRGILHVVPAGSAPVSIPGLEIENLREALTRDVLLDPIRRLPEGSLVEVRSGALKGLTGRLVRHGTRHRLVISIDLLQQGVEAEVDEADVAPLRQGRAAS